MFYVSELNLEELLSLYLHQCPQNTIFFFFTNIPLQNKINYAKLYKTL